MSSCCGSSLCRIRRNCSYLDNGSARGSTGSVPEGKTKLFSYSFFNDFRQKDTSFSGVAAIDSIQFGTKASIADGPYQTTHVDLVSGGYFSVLGVPAFLGRTRSNPMTGWPEQVL